MPNCSNGDVFIKFVLPDELASDDSVDDLHLGLDMDTDLGCLFVGDTEKEQLLGPVIGTLGSSCKDNRVNCVTVDNATVDDDVDGTSTE